METGNKNRERIALLIVLPLVAFFCLMLWYVRNYYRVDNLIRVQLENGNCDLNEINFDTGFVHLSGEVEYIPGILTPEEFVQRQSEAQSGNPWNISSGTSRIRIQVPDGTYTLAGRSIDFASRAYVNGELRFEAGNPAETAEEFEPGFSQMILNVVPENGIIEIVQQGANFVHRGSGGHSNLYFGKPSILQQFMARTLGPEYITVGLLVALFLMHLILFFIHPAYRPNVIFSLFCLTWAIRIGVTNAKVFFAMFPALPWEIAFRAEYLSLPIATFLMALLAREMFPGVPQKWFVRIVGVVSAGFGVLCLGMNTVLLSKVLILFEAFFTLAIIYLSVRFTMKVPGLVRAGEFRIEHTASFIGFTLFMVAGINDALYHLNVYQALGVTTAFAMTGVAILIFSFYQMTAMFYGTMREAALAHERERRAEAEKEMFSEMNRLKSTFYTDMSHEMKTPLTVIAVNAQFAAQNIEAGAVDEETVTDLAAISSEAKRLAQMVTSLVGIGRMQGEEGGAVSLAPLINETARIYQSLFARRGNTLAVELASDLPLVAGNVDQVIQVLINLLSNANRHTENGAVWINAEVDSSQKPEVVIVSVTDNGEGIEPELLPHVFERFFHGEKGSSGLGLSICKTIIEEYGGQIGIGNVDTKGTRVWFTLPVKEEMGE